MAKKKPAKNSVDSLKHKDKRKNIPTAELQNFVKADSPEGMRKEAEVSFSRHSRENGNPETKGLDARLRTPAYNLRGQASGMTKNKTENDIKKGFVYKRVPHITLKSIANNPDIKEGMSREEIDVAIKKHADTEILYDQPYTDNKRIRVSGPFTVESLSPHRILSTDEERPKSEKTPEKLSGHGQFETMILDNLKKAGVQNTIKNERLKFDHLEPFAGLYIHGDGEFTETPHPPINTSGAGSNPLPQGAREKSFKDPIISEKMRQYGKLTVLLARMNPDLAMGDELLKKTGAGNLFMIFGEPDIVIEKISSSSVIPAQAGIQKTKELDARLKTSGMTKQKKVINHYGDEVLKVYDVGKS